MGAIVGALTQSSGDQAAASAALSGFKYGTKSPLATTFGPNGVGANNVISQLMGNTPVTAQTTTGFQNYLTNTGFNTALKTSQMGINNQAAANGTYNSGATLRAQDANATNMASTATTNYLQSLLGLNSTGANSYAAITQAGQQGGTAAAQAQEAAANAQGQAAGGIFNALFGNFL